MSKFRLFKDGELVYDSETDPISILEVYVGEIEMDEEEIKCSDCVCGNMTNPMCPQHS
jgi:hypothetical protein